MDYTEKMELALRQVKDACLANDSFDECDRCPFLDICELCEDNDMGFPEEWSFD